MTPARVLFPLLFSSLVALACTEASPVQTTAPSATAITSATPGMTPPPGGASSTTTPPARQTPSPVPAVAIPQSFRDFARRVSAAAAAGDLAFFRTRAETEPITCTADNTPPPGP